MLGRLFLSVTACVIWLISTQAYALTVSPLQVEMTSVGSKSRAQITVVNTSDQPIAVEAALQKVLLDEQGVPKGSKAGDEFLIMPPQAIIAPGATQNFRVQWLGEPMLDKSESYILYINQIPVKLPAGKSAVQLVMSMGAMINVAPPEGRPGLTVVETSIVTDKSGKKHPAITVQNPTKVHALLPMSTIQLTSGSWSTTLPSSVLQEKLGIGLVQPGRRRKFVLPVELPQSVSSVQASVTLAQLR